MASYELVDVEGYDNWGVRIVDGKYKDVIIGYGAVSAEEVPGQDQAKLNFQLGVLDLLKKKLHLKVMMNLEC